MRFAEIRKYLFKFTVFEYDRDLFFTIFLCHKFQHSYRNFIVATGLVNIKCLNYFVYIFILKSKDDNFVSVIHSWFSGNLLSFGKGLHCVEKYLLNRWASSLKFATAFLPTETGRIIGIFLLL